MPKMPDTLVQILAAGGGVIVDGSQYPPDLLVRMAAAARGSGATLILRNADSKMPNDLVRIAAAGIGKVIFEL